MHVKKLTYSQAKKRHPEEVEKIVRALRRGKSIHKDAKPEELSWSYECAVRNRDSGNFQDLISGKIEARRIAFEKLPFEERVQKTVADTTTTLNATIGQWYKAERVPNPREILIQTRKRFRKAQVETDTFEAMSEEQKKRQTQEALDELKGLHHGFVSIGFQLPRGGRD